MADPPLLAGVAHLTVACPRPAVATTSVGAPGVVEGNTGEDGSDSGPVPMMFVAFTVNVYDVPLLSPVNAVVVALAVTVAPPGLAVTMYCVIGAPPLSAGG